MSTLTRSAARGTVSLTVAHAGLVGAGYVVAVVLAQGLGPALYGVYGIIYSLLLGVELIGRLGVPQALSKLIAEEPGPATELEGTGFTVTVLMYGAIFVLFWLAGPWLATTFHVDDGAALFRLAAWDIPFYGLYFVCNNILNGRREFGAEAAGILIYALAKVVGIGGLVIAGLSVEGALVVNIVSSVVALAYVAARVGRAPFRFTLRAAGPLLRLAIPIGLYAAGSQVLQSLDLWTLNAAGADIDDEVKGLYVAATNVARLPNMISFVMMAVLVPSIARAARMGDDEAVRSAVEGAFRFLAVTLLLAAAIVAVEARPILALLFSPSYRAGGPLLTILILSHGALFTTLVTACAILIASGHARTAAAATLLLLPASLVLNLVLIHFAGAKGAALASFLSMTLGTAVTAGTVHRRVARIRLVRAVAPALPAAAATAALAAWIPTDGVLLLLELGGLAVFYTTIVAALGGIGRAELRHLLPARGR